MSSMEWDKAREASKAASSRRAGLEGGGYPLGSREICWCSEPANHTWPGQAQDAPHPRPAG